ncbi:MAG: tetratricopeptide repeat protein, partial [bacterium]
EAGATEAEEPSRSWNLLDADDAAPRIPRHPIRDRLREKQRERRRIAPAPRAVPVVPEPPPSFGEADAFVPANARAALNESWQRWAPGIEATLHQTHDALPAGWQRSLDRLGAFSSGTGGRRTLLALLAGLIVLLGVARIARGRGDLVVCIAYPDDLRGSFTVTLSRRKPHARAPGAERSGAPGQVSTRTAHYLVARETQFRGLTPGRYWITVDGELFAGSGDSPIEEPFESQLVQVRSRDTHRLEFDLRPRSCSIEVKAVWDRQTVRECTIAARGRPDTLRHTKGQSVRIGLPIGRHVIAVGSGDRVTEREIDVDSYSTQVVEVDLGKADGVLFKGCPPAVAPYMQGDVQTAARALAREGQDKVSNFLLARMHVEQGNRARAAEHFEYAEYFRDAAGLREELTEFAKAAALYQKAGQPVRAGEMYERSGDPVRAGKAYETAAELDRALACYRAGGDTEREIGVLERRGDTFAAAKLARERDDRARAIKLLQQVTSADPNYT